MIRCAVRDHLRIATTSATSDKLHIWSAQAIEAGLYIAAVKGWLPVACLLISFLPADPCHGKPDDQGCTTPGASSKPHSVLQLAHVAQPSGLCSQPGVQPWWRIPRHWHSQRHRPALPTACLTCLSVGHTAEASKGQLRRSRSTCMRGGDVGERECVECNSGIMQCKGYDAECGVHSGRFRAGPSPNPACLEGLHVLLCMSSVS